jgi:hypothetical protein
MFGGMLPALYFPLKSFTPSVRLAVLRLVFNSVRSGSGSSAFAPG